MLPWRSDALCVCVCVFEFMYLHNTQFVYSGETPCESLTM